MEYVVEGQTISAEELADASWHTPGYRAQERRRRELQNQGKPNVDPSASGHNARTSAPGPRHQVKPRPPPIHRRVPLPRLPQNTIHIVGRPRTPIDLTKVPPWQLHEALLTAASLPDQPPATHRPLKTVPHLFYHSKPATARTTAVTGPDLAPGAQDPAQLIAESADLAPTYGDRDPVQPYEPLQHRVRLAKALEQYLRR
ncbi:hypothetical protein HPB50_007306 [Hyalomma asiaticum]|uniref:Uncharacterized protein n=1 Tax=Hyalomma asiaticum TaxID=266040 RepID=A0ACB7SER7_HYAAI|nr:hypothetical protein HPB50_007306 [Hyalomma asiaticum]